MINVMGTLGGLLFNTSLGVLQQYLGAAEHPEIYGQTLAAFIAFSYFVSTPFIYLAGKEYVNFMDKKDQESFEAATADGR